MITKQQQYARSIYKVKHGEFLHKCSDFDWMADIVLKQTSSFFMQSMKKPALSPGEEHLSAPGPIGFRIFLDVPEFVDYFYFLLLFSNIIKTKFVFVIFTEKTTLTCDITRTKANLINF